MFKWFLSSLFLITAGTASAQACPDFFRFADFGLQDAEGQFSAGGPHFRAESLTGAFLLNVAQTQCRDVRYIASDGHGNPIPVVAHISYDTSKTDIELSALHVSYSANTRVAAKENAQRHSKRLSHQDADPVRGPNSLCLELRDEGVISCQLVSPYSSNIELIVYCDQDKCVMSALAFNSNIMVSAVWPVPETFVTKTTAAGPQIFARIQAIHKFLKPLSSGR